MRGALLLVLVAAVGCSSKTSPGVADAGPKPPAVVVVTRLEVQDATPAAARPVAITQAQLMQRVRGALTTAGYQLDTPPGPATWRAQLSARVRYGVTAGDGLLVEVGPGTARAVWGVELELKAPGQSVGSHTWLEGDADLDFAGGDAAALQPVLLAQVAKAFEPVASGLVARRETISLSEAALIERLKAPEAAARWAAVDRLAELRATAAVPALATLATTEADRTIALRVVGALAEIGDARAANALIDLADPKDRERLRAVVEALSVVGGERVDDFLDILASHDAPDVRQMVEQARARRARAPKKEVSP